MLFASTAARAAPSAVVSAPTGTVYKEGDLVAYTSQTATGAQAGLWSGLTTGAGRFFAIEVGADVWLPTDERGARATPLANAKIALADERGWRPATALGVYQLSSNAESSADLVYISFTKAFASRRTEFGSLTLGTFASLAPAERTTRCADACAFRGSFPMADDRWGLLAGWSSPPVGPFHLAMDVITGTSLASGANALVTLDAEPYLHPFVGMNFAVDRRQELHPSDVLFVGVVFSPKVGSRADPRPCAGDNCARR